MIQESNPLWQVYARQTRVLPGTRLAEHVGAALASPAVELQRRSLAALGLTMNEEPLLWKWMPGDKLRLFFDVRGADARFAAADVVALVLLHDVARATALYAHPVHAGPATNPLLAHLGGPMAQPTAQPGHNGELATHRLLEHKRAIWDRLALDRVTLGDAAACALWRQRYAWSLVRLYFCGRCSACAFGHPAYEGMGSEQVEATSAAPHGERFGPAELWADAHSLVAAIHDSPEWAVETAYVRRGGFEIEPEPRLLADLPGGCTLAIFPSDATWVEGGTIVGLAVYSRGTQVFYVHTLCAGEEEEIQFLRGDTALGLPPPREPSSLATARRQYAQWRRDAWSRYWLDELEHGQLIAGQRWLAAYWQALADLSAVAPVPAVARSAARFPERVGG